MVYFALQVAKYTKTRATGKYDDSESNPLPAIAGYKARLFALGYWRRFRIFRRIRNPESDRRRRLANRRSDEDDALASEPRNNSDANVSINNRNYVTSYLLRILQLVSDEPLRNEKGAITFLLSRPECIPVT